VIGKARYIGIDAEFVGMSEASETVVERFILHNKSGAKEGKMFGNR
jgi:hypothetical protein